MNPESTLRELSSSQPAPRVPDHEMLRPIGRGSYGEVWLARNALGTLRAVKVVFRDHFEDARPFEREYTGIRKYEPLSRSHPGLIDILQVGRNDGDGYFYYVMELADDAESAVRRETAAAHASSRTKEAAPVGSLDRYSPRTLTSERARRGRLSAQECIALGVSLAEALAELHRHRLIHRDIKPSNIIFVGGVAKLADIGLVTEASDSFSYVGTEGFIPPEGPNSAQADIFSLGKVLYETAMGKDRLDFPEPATRLEELPDRDALLELNAVLLKACQPDRQLRYATAAAMQAELELLRRGQSVRARRSSQRRVRWLIRAGAVLGAVTLAALGVDRVLDWRARALQGQSSTIAPRLAAKVGARSPKVPERCLDLSSAYTAPLNERWYPGPIENTLASLPHGLQTIGGVPFDIRGLVQLAGGELSRYDADYPRLIPGLRLQRWVQRFHFLQGAISEVTDGTVIGCYRIYYNTTRSLDVPIVFGRNVRGLWQPKRSDGTVSQAALAWRGQNSATEPRDLELRLYHFTWDNPWPTEEIVAIDFSSSGANAAPFLVGLTADDAVLREDQKQRSVDLVAAIQKAGRSFGELPEASGPEPPSSKTFNLFAAPAQIGGRYYDGVRFKAPPGQPMDLIWTFGPAEAHLHNWFILPMHGGMKVGFEDWLHVSPARRNSEAKPSDFVVQYLSGRKLQPGREYLIWFGSDTNRPVELSARLKFVPPGSVDPIQPADLLKALAIDLGEKTPAVHRHYCLGAIH